MAPAAQQARFDAFCRDFNHQRPHEALDQVPPASLWQPSPRRLPLRPAEPWYDAHHAVRKVRASGEIIWGGRSVFVRWPDRATTKRTHQEHC